MAKKPIKTTDSTATTSTPPALGPATRPESKKARLIGMLRQPDGSTIAAISAALGWQAHTTRAAITGLRKAGHAVETAKPVDGSIGLIYQIASKPGEQADGVTRAEAAQ
jgi:predicted ArsR family transcriptional regulator